jgi:signal peptidase
MEEKVKVKKPLWKRILSRFGTLLALSIIGFAVYFEIASQASRSSNYGVAVVFNTSSLLVETDSMEPEYSVGSGIIVQKVDPSTIKIGDDLTFYRPDRGVVVTHRCSAISVDQNGIYTFTVHGINTESDQCTGDCTGQTQVFTEQYLIGKVVYHSAALGGFLSFITSIYGILILVLIPAGYLIGMSIKDIVVAMKNKDDGEANSAKEVKDEHDEIKADDRIFSLSEADKERLKKELLNELMNDKEGKDK